MKYAITFLFLVFNLFSTFATELPPLFTRKGYQFQSKLSYFTSNSNYSAEGSAFEELPNNQKISLFQTDLRLNYNFSSNWIFWTETQFSQISTVGASQTRTNGVFSHMRIGAFFNLDPKPLGLAPEFSLLIPFYKVDTSSDNAVPAEGSMAFDASIWTRKRIYRFNSYSQAGVTFRDGQRSHLFHWKIGANKKVWQSYWGLEVNGLHSMNDDAELNSPQNKYNHLNSVNAGSLKFYNINPELYHLTAWSGFAILKKHLFRVGIDKTLNGKNTANGLTAFVRYSLRFGQENNTTDQPKKRSKRKYEEEFIPDYYNQDSEYFNDDVEIKQKRKRKRR